MSLHHSVLDESWLHYRHAESGVRVAAGLPALFVALARDEVRDFPSLRPHQRHPWHAFLVQLAAIALHASKRSAPFETEQQWRDALLALTPDQPDGAAWCLISPLDQPALLQPPVPEGSLAGWKGISTPDALDMLITSKNHDLKGGRMQRGTPEDWLFSLISLQTQEGVIGAPAAGWFGISRMNKAFGSRPGVGIVPVGNFGKRWLRDVMVLIRQREDIAQQQEMAANRGHSLIWLLPWDGKSSLAFSSLDPFYIEVCRRIRMTEHAGAIRTRAVGSKAARIQAKDREGRTGDAWTPIDAAVGKALTIASEGFHYRLASELLFGSKYRSPPAQQFTPEDGSQGLAIQAQGVTRGQGKTEGYHERRIPISPKTARMIRGGQVDVVAKLSKERIEAIGELRKLLWSALCVLLSNGNGKDASDTTKNRAGIYARRFETTEDARFFRDLTEEVEADDDTRTTIYEDWLLACAERAEAVLKAAFEVAPRSGIQRYRAQAAALSRFHGSLRGPKSPLPILRRLLSERASSKQLEDANDVHA